MRQEATFVVAALSWPSTEAEVRAWAPIGDREALSRSDCARNRDPMLLRPNLVAGRMYFSSDSGNAGYKQSLADFVS